MAIFFRSREHARTAISNAFKGAPNTISEGVLNSSLGGKDGKAYANAMFKKDYKTLHTNVYGDVQEYKRPDSIPPNPNRPFIEFSKFITDERLNRMSDLDLIKYELAYNNRFAPPTRKTRAKEADFLKELCAHQDKKQLADEKARGTLYDEVSKARKAIQDNPNDAKTKKQYGSLLSKREINTAFRGESNLVSLDMLTSTLGGENNKAYRDAM